MSGTVTEKWFWITVVSVIFIVALPLIVIWGILKLPPEVRLFATITLILVWGVVSGYKDWIVAKRTQEPKSKEPAK